MIRYYLNLYWVSISRSLISRLEYKKDLFIGIFGFLLENVASICSIYFIIRNIPSLAGWGIYQMGFLYGFTMMPIAVDHLLTDELWRVAYFRVKKGDLDRYFLRPTPILFQVISETFQPEAFGELIVGTIMLIICGAKCNIQWSLGKVVMIFVATVFGALIVTGIKILTAAPAFIIKKSGFIMQILYNFRDYTKYPIKIYPSAIRFMLMFLFPFGLIISMPVENLMFDIINPWLLSSFIMIMSVIFMSFSITFWNACVRRYESTGS
ncbi:MAG: ABC-2 family transporter protein [Lachnospiraceae bacterium]|nr:ABC-2 family transporter protein [Lachnospiraceae bacterium]